MGARGVRVDLQSIDKSLTDSELEGLLQQYADAIRPLNWPVICSTICDGHRREYRTLAASPRLCIDHFGHFILSEQTVYAQTRDPYTLPGFLEERNTIAKLSAPYKIGNMHDISDLEPVASEILKVAGKIRVVFVTDWPHTRFKEVGIDPWVGMVFDWCREDSSLVERLSKRNAEDLWA